MQIIIHTRRSNEIFTSPHGSKPSGPSSGCTYCSRMKQIILEISEELQKKTKGSLTSLFATSSRVETVNSVEECLEGGVEAHFLSENVVED
jgi:hypothetical protein